MFGFQAPQRQFYLALGLDFAHLAESTAAVLTLASL